MSHVKAGGSSKNIHNNAGQRLGVKRFGGQKVTIGQVLVRQTGSTKIAGPGTFMSKNFTIHAAQDGVVVFKKVKKGRFTGKTVPRTQVLVEEAPKAATTPR
jgi:large subunit ribosomal protein L27